MKKLTNLLSITFLSFIFIQCQHTPSNDLDSRWSEERAWEWHKDNGWMNLSNDENKNIFDLTIGGYGFTGTIVSVTLKLIDFEGFNFQTTINKISSINESVKFIKNNKEKNNLIYSWNRIDPNSRNFGDGLIFCNSVNSKKSENSSDMMKTDRPRFLKNFFRFCFWNKLSVKTFNYFFLNYYIHLKKNVYKDNFSKFF